MRVPFPDLLRPWATESSKELRPIKAHATEDDPIPMPPLMGCSSEEAEVRQQHGYVGPDSEATLSTERTAHVVMKNCLPVKLRSITLTHQYSNETVESKTWENIMPDETTTNPFRCNFWIGIDAWGYDSWKIAIEFMDGVTFASRWEACYMKDEDSQGTLVFTVEGPRFYMNLRGKRCHSLIEMPMSNYSFYAFARVHNGFPVATYVSMDQRHGNDGSIQKLASTVIAKDGYSEYWPVYSRLPRLGEWDYWNLSVVPQLVAPTDDPAIESKALVNAEKDTRCAIYQDDRGRSFDVNISSRGWHINIPSSCRAHTWRTPLGREKVVFISIFNGFQETIRYVLLQHKFATNPAHTYIYGAIEPQKKSTGMRMVEFDIVGPWQTHDQWTISVFLTNGAYYQNVTPGYSCWLDESDATKGQLTFSVNSDQFDMALDAGCKDSMKLIKPPGNVDYWLGADLDRPYNKNSYLASHNSFANFDAGFWIGNQSVSISAQLAQGVTTLLIDIYIERGDIYMLHMIPGIRKNVPFAQQITLLDGLKVIAAHLDMFPELFLTIVIEDGITSGQQQQRKEMLQQRFEQANLWNRVYLPPQTQHNGDWPTLRNLLEVQKKRLVVFTSYDGSDSAFPHQWSFMAETVFGNKSIDPATWTEFRNESVKDWHTHSLSAMNHFATLNWQTVIDNWARVKEVNSIDLIKRHLNDLQTNGLKAPNFVAFDFIEYGDAIDAVRLCNERLHGTSNTSAAASVDQESGECSLLDDGESYVEV